MPRPIRPQVCRSYISCLNSRASISNRFPPALAAAVSATCSTSADRYLDEPRITYCEELLLRRETPQSTLRVECRKRNSVTSAAQQPKVSEIARKLGISLRTLARGLEAHQRRFECSPRPRNTLAHFRQPSDGVLRRSANDGLTASRCPHPFGPLACVRFCVWVAQYCYYAISLKSGWNPETECCSLG